MFGDWVICREVFKVRILVYFELFFFEGCYNERLGWFFMVLKFSIVIVSCVKFLEFKYWFYFKRYLGC